MKTHTNQPCLQEAVCQGGRWKERGSILGIQCCVNLVRLRGNEDQRKTYIHPIPSQEFLLRLWPLLHIDLLHILMQKELI